MLNQKFIKLIDVIELKVLNLNFKTFLLIKNVTKSVYLMVPTGLMVQKIGKLLTLQYNSETINTQLSSDFTFFYLKLTSLNVNIKKIHTKKLLLKGLGLKATILHSNLVELKLGFSHTITLSIPNEIKLTIIKNTLVLESADQILLGNFSATIKSFKTPDSYKGKGICYKNEVLLLKAVKKT